MLDALLVGGARSAGGTPLVSAEQAPVVWAVAATYVVGFLAMSTAGMQRLHWIERLAALFVGTAAAAHAALVLTAPTWPWRAAFAVASVAGGLSVALLALGRPWRWLALGVLVGSMAGYAVETVGGGDLEAVGIGVKAVEAMGLVAVALSGLPLGRHGGHGAAEAADQGASTALTTQARPSAGSSTARWKAQPPD